MPANRFRYTEIISNYSFANFDMNYIDYPIAEIQQEWVAQGGQDYELIEPVDGYISLHFLYLT